MAKKTKRGYSREFSAKTTDTRVRYELDMIPPQLYKRVTKTARANNISLRTLTLKLWTAWLDGRLPVLDVTVPHPADESDTP